MPQGLYVGDRNKSQFVMNDIIELRNAHQRSKSLLMSRLKCKICLLEILYVSSMTMFYKISVKSYIDKPTNQSDLYVWLMNAGEGIIK